MTETIRGEVIHVVPPDELEEYELVDELRTLAESRYVVVCRVGGTPSWFERIWAFLRRSPIRPVTVVAERGPTEGEDVTMIVQETRIPGVYEATEIR